MANTIRPITEEGIVLSKQYKEALNSFISKNGETVPAQPEKFIVKVASSYSCTEKDGLLGVQILDYKVDKATYTKLKFLDKVQVCYEFSTSGTNKPVSLNLIK